MCLIRVCVVVCMRMRYIDVGYLGQMLVLCAAIRLAEALTVRILALCQSHGLVPWTVADCGDDVISAPGSRIRQSARVYVVCFVLTHCM
jgi:hypothetical protein